MSNIWPSYQPFVTHIDPEVRQWALQRMMRSSPDEARSLARIWLESTNKEEIDDDDFFAATEVLGALGTADDVPLMRRIIAQYPKREELPFLFRALARLQCGDFFQDRAVSESNVEFWHMWGGFAPASCVTALMALMERGKSMNCYEPLIEYSAPSDIPRLLSLMRSVEDKQHFATLLLSRMGANDLLADAPSEAFEHAQNELEFIVTDLEFPAETEAEKKALSSLKKRLWKLTPWPAVSAETSEPKMKWAEALRAALLANTRGGSLEARMAYAAMIGERRLVFLREKVSSLPLETLVDLRSFVPEQILLMVDDAIVACWSASSEEARAAALAEFIEQVDDELAPNESLPALLLRLPGETPDRNLLALHSEVNDKEQSDRIVDYFTKHPERLKALAEEELGKGRYELALYFLMDELPDAWPTTLLLERFDTLWADADQRWAMLACFESRGDPAVIERLLSMWLPGEEELASTIYFLAQIAGREKELPATLIKEATEEEDTEDRRLHLSLRCTACGSAYTYHARYAQISEDGSVCVMQPIDCKRCKARDQYEATEETSEELLELLKEEAELPEEQRVTWKEPLVGGSPSPSTWSEGLQQLQENAEQHPEGAEVWEALGMHYMSASLRAEATEVLEKACTIEETVHTLLMLVTCYIGERDFAKGIQRLGRAVERFLLEDDPQSDRQIENLCGLLELVANEHEGPLGLRATMSSYEQDKKGNLIRGGTQVDIGVLGLRGFARWDLLAALLASDELLSLTLVEEEPAEDSKFTKLFEKLSADEESKTTPKVGRNEPCPCGSGQKYKKCHGK